MLTFGRTCEQIAGKSAKLEKIALLADYLRSLRDPDLEAATRYFTGNPFAAREQKTLALGARTIIAAAQNAWGFDDRQLHLNYREHGDLGAALCGFVRPSPDLGLFKATLTPAALKLLFDDIAGVFGKTAGKKRQLLCERIFGACTHALEAKYIIKIMTGDLRIGLREGLVFESLAFAFGRAAPQVRRAAMLSGDIGTVAVAARIDALAELRIAYGAPLAFMLASPIQFGSTYRELQMGSWIVEDKFDGIRAQLHKLGRAVHIYSRTLNDVSNSYPEVLEAAQRLSGDFILDGELVAHRDGRVLPFRYLQARLQRKSVPAELLAQIPVQYVCFDMLAFDAHYLLDEPLRERRAKLAERLRPDERIVLAPWKDLNDNDSGAQLQERFDDARARGHEGLLLKRADAAYHPGRRGKWWLKLKRELSTLDVVVVAVEWGHGKRAKVLSDYTFAVRGQRGDLVTIGKAYSGLTDAEIAELTPWFLEHATASPTRHRVAVEPQIVLEVAFDIIQKSELHSSGFALRFPRIVRLRHDKPPSEIDSLARVEEIYTAMLLREGVQL
ncbi:MAG: ATP-dependent DNA ligase [Candidatus Eremiobacteraeota bacterium]|nr:ATP-dependent DNA ligase [Candidatus Eremiobacteraeota bacterium]